MILCTIILTQFYSSQQEDNVRTRLHIMDQWIAELAHESEIDKVREVHGEEEDCSKEPIIQTDSEGSSSHNVPEVQREHMEHPLTLEDSSMTIVTSDVSLVESCFL